LENCSGITGKDILVYQQPSNQTAVLSIEKHVILMSKKSEASQAEHQENVGDPFYSSGICFSRPDFYSALLLGSFVMSDGTSPRKASRTTVEPQLMVSQIQ